MPSGFFALTLDTTPPRVTLGTPVVVGGILKLPYTINEPGIEVARAVDAQGREYVGAITELDVRFTLEAEWTHGVVTLDLRDSVGNFGQSTSSQSTSPVRVVVRSAPPLPAGATQVPPPRYFTEIVDMTPAPRERRGRRGGR